MAGGGREGVNSMCHASRGLGFLFFGFVLFCFSSISFLVCINEAFFLLRRDGDRQGGGGRVRRRGEAQHSRRLRAKRPRSTLCRHGVPSGVHKTGDDDLRRGCDGGIGTVLQGEHPGRVVVPHHLWHPCHRLSVRAHKRRELVHVEPVRGDQGQDVPVRPAGEGLVCLVQHRQDLFGASRVGLRSVGCHAPKLREERRDSQLALVLPDAGEDQRLEPLVAARTRDGLVRPLPPALPQEPAVVVPRQDRPVRPLRPQRGGLEPRPHHRPPREHHPPRHGLEHHHRHVVLLAQLPHHPVVRPHQVLPRVPGEQQQGVAVHVPGPRLVDQLVPEHRLLVPEALRHRPPHPRPRRQPPVRVVVDLLEALPGGLGQVPVPPRLQREVQGPRVRVPRLRLVHHPPRCPVVRPQQRRQHVLVHVQEAPHPALPQRLHHALDGRHVRCVVLPGGWVHPAPHHRHTEGVEPALLKHRHVGVVHQGAGEVVRPTGGVSAPLRLLHVVEPVEDAHTPEAVHQPPPLPGNP
eukprot:Sspe_Gene.25169::Locus_10091_Transcript_2_2_Confidence_0.556_Length_1847::g.25169::m.25169